MCASPGGRPPEPPDAAASLITRRKAETFGRLGSRRMASFPPRMGFTAFRSLSRAMLRGFVRDRTALAFTILLPVLFLALFGSIYRNTATPRLSVIEVGNVSLLSHVADQ